MVKKVVGPGRETKRAAQGAETRVAFFEGVELERGISLRDQVYKLVRKAIVTGKLPPKALIDEAEIASS